MSLKESLDLGGSGLIVPAAFLAIAGPLALASYQDKKDSALYSQPAAMDAEQADTGAVLSVVAIALAIVVLAAAVAIFVVSPARRGALKWIASVGFVLLVASAFLTAIGLWYIYESTIVAEGTRNTASDEAIDYETISWVFASFGVMLTLFLGSVSYGFCMSELNRVQGRSSRSRM